MATTFTAENATEALILEQALAYARQLQRTAGEAADGQVLRSAEAFVLERGAAAKAASTKAEPSTNS